MDYTKLDKELEKAIRKMDLGRGQNFSSLFEDFLDAVHIFVTTLQEKAI